MTFPYPDFDSIGTICLFPGISPVSGTRIFPAGPDKNSKKFRQFLRYRVHNLPGYPAKKSPQVPHVHFRPPVPAGISHANHPPSLSTKGEGDVHPWSPPSPSYLFTLKQIISPIPIRALYAPVLPIRQGHFRNYVQKPPFFMHAFFRNRQFARNYVKRGILHDAVKTIMDDFGRQNPLWIDPW